MNKGRLTRVGRAFALVLLMIGRGAEVRAQEQVEYYGTDAIGSIRIVFDASGAVKGRMDFAPFGEALQPGPGMGNQVFAQLSFDGETDLDYAEMRMYQPRVGRLNAIDPVYTSLFRPQLLNRYAYAANNPVSLIDPTGTVVFSSSSEPGCSNPEFASICAMWDWLSEHWNAGSGGGGSPAGGLHGDDGGGGGGGVPSGGTGSGTSVLDSVQNGLDGLSIGLDTTGVGGTISWIPDAGNTVISALRGNWPGAGLSALGMIPYLGNAANAARLARGTSVLGHHPGYLEKAAELGARAFNIPDRIYNKMSAAEQWAANQKFLDRLIARGDDVVLTNPVGRITPQSTLEKEVAYLLNRGYEVVESGWRLILGR